MSQQIGVKHGQLVQRRRNKRNRARKGRARDRLPDSLMTNHKIPRYLLIGPNPPERLYSHTCNFPDITILQNGAASFVLFELQINALYDIYASTGGPKVTNFEAAALVYQNYQALTMGMKLDCANHESYAIDVSVIFRDKQPSVDITTWLAARQAFSVGIGFKPRLLGSTSSMNRTVFSIPQRSGGQPLSLASLLGQPQQYISDISWTSDATTIPAQRVWMAIIVTSPSATTNLPNGLQIDLTLNWVARWFSLGNDQSHLAKSLPPVFPRSRIKN